MKFTIALGLMSLAMVLSAPANEKRFIEQLGNLFGPAGPTLLVLSLRYVDIDSLKCEAEKILHSVGTNTTEAACEGACNNIATFSLGSDSCTLFCKSFQTVVTTFHIVPADNLDDCLNQLTTPSA